MIEIMLPFRWVIRYFPKSGPFRSEWVIGRRQK